MFQLILEHRALEKLKLEEERDKDITIVLPDF